MAVMEHDDGILCVVFCVALICSVAVVGVVLCAEARQCRRRRWRARQRDSALNY